MSDPTACPIGRASTSGYRYGCRCRGCVEAKHAYNAATRERERARFRDYYQRERSRRLANSAAWARNNPDLDLARVVRRRLRLAGAEVCEVTQRDWRRLCDRYGHRCAYCGQKAKLTQDHVIPISRGGRHSIGNLLPACGPCNFSKHARLLIEWRVLRPVA